MMMMYNNKIMRRSNDTHSSAQQHKHMLAARALIDNNTGVYIPCMCCCVTCRVVVAKDMQCYVVMRIEWDKGGTQGLLSAAIYCIL